MANFRQGARGWKAAALGALLLAVCGQGRTQENPLGQVTTPAPVKTEKPAEAAEAPGALKLPKSTVPRLRVEANLVLVPMTVDRSDEPPGDGT